MKQSIRIAGRAAGHATIDIEGTIGVPEQWQFDDPAGRVATYEKFSRTLEAIARLRGGEITVNIRSTGGDVGDALMIYDALTSTGAAITTRCHGYVASAATVIAQAASAGRREISSSALYLVHNSVASCEGNAAELGRGVELLAKTDRRIAAIYALHSGRTEEEFAALMAENNGNGRWLSPTETVAAGLADRVTDAARAAAPSKRRGLFARNNSRDTLAEPHASAPSPVTPPDTLPDISPNFSPDGEQARRAIAAAMDAQRRAAPVELPGMEDPLPADRHRSPNETAYRLDAENLRP